MIILRQKLFIGMPAYVHFDKGNVLNKQLNDFLVVVSIFSVMVGLARDLQHS